MVLGHSREGLLLHQLSGRFGTDFGGRVYNPNRNPYRLNKAARIIILSPFLSKYEKDNIGLSEKVIWCRNWGEALAELAGKHGSGTKVGVYPYASLQIPT